MPKLDPAGWFAKIGFITCLLITCIIASFIFDRKEYSVTDVYEVGPGKPYFNIQSAVNALIETQWGMPFDTEKKIKIYAKQGEGYDACYNEAITIWGLKPTQDHRLIIEGDGNLAMIASSQDIKYVKMLPVKVYPGAAFTVKSPFVTIRKLRIGGNGYPVHCIEDKGIYVSEKGFVIEDCTWYKTHHSQVYLARGANSAVINRNTFCLSGTSAVEIEPGVNNCLICNNTMVGMQHGIICRGKNHRIYNNTIIKSSKYVAGSCIYFPETTCGNIDIKNNIFVADYPSSCFSSNGLPAGISSDNNLFFSFLTSFIYDDCTKDPKDRVKLTGWKKISGQDTNSLYGDPIFFFFNGYKWIPPYGDSPPFYINTDLRLREGSAAIGRGKVLSGIFDTDILGKKRKNLWDIGAYARQ